MKNHGGHQGFTLLEAILYIALFSLLLGGMLPAAFQILQSANRTLTANAIREEAIFLDRKMAWALSGAIDVHSPSPKTIVITRFDGGTDNPIIFAAKDTTLTLQRGNHNVLSLHAERFSITDVVFNLQTPSSTNPGIVTFLFKIAKTPFAFRYSLPGNYSFYNLCPQ